MKLVVSEKEVARMRFRKETGASLTWKKVIAITIEARFRCCTLQSTESEFAWFLPLPSFLVPSPICFVHILATSFISSYQFIPLSSFATERRVGRQVKFSLQRHQSLFYQRGGDVLGDDAWEPFRSTNNASLFCCRLENVIDVILTMVQWQRRLLGTLQRCYVAWLYKCIILIITVLLFVSITL